MPEEKFEINKEEAEQIIFSIEFIDSQGFTSDDVSYRLKEKLEKWLQQIQG